MDRILAVIAAHNRRETTLNIISNIKKMESLEFRLDVLVIDDGSSDGTGAAILERFADVKVELGDGNLWWGGALNVGYRYALRHGYDYVYTLNDDNELRENTLSELYKAAKNNPGAVCGSVILGESGLIISAGLKFSAFFGKVLNPWRNHRYASIQEDFMSCQTLSTRSTLFPSEVLKRGIFIDDKRFPHNFSDHDFFDRVRRSGFNLLVARRSVVVAGESTSNFPYFILSHKLEQILPTFFDVKYANNFRTQWNIASRNANPVFALLRFVYFVSPSIVLLLMRCILPRKELEALLVFLGKYQRGTDVQIK